MLRKLVGGLALMAVTSTVLLAQQGTVTTKDGKQYEGNVTEKGQILEITGVPGLDGPVEVNRANVESVTYPDKVADEVRAALPKLKSDDFKSRIELAKVAIDAHAYDAARDALNEAAKISPGNAEIAELRQKIAAQMPAAPTTAPAAPTTAPGPAHLAPGALPPPALKRNIVPFEINEVRQLEWRGEDEPIRVILDADAKRRFLQHYTDITAADFNALTPVQQANLMLSKGPPGVFPGVQIMSDPAAILEFKRGVSRVILQSCATANCHGGDKAGTFKLINPAAGTTALYTDYVILQTSVGVNGPGGRPIIDRVNPEASLLLQYMLPPDQADTPHPKTPAYHGAVRNKNDPRYMEILHWIQSLNPVAPRYGIDLTQEAPKAPPR